MMKFDIFYEIHDERFRQQQLWGTQDHPASFWLTILAEEFGEVARAILEDDRDNYREELIQCAAVCIAMVEAYDRGTSFKEK